VVGKDLLDAGLLSRVRFIAGAAALLGLSLPRSERPVVGRANLLPALWLGVYAVCISYGYLHIGAAGTFVFYASVLLTLVAGSGRVQGLLRRWRPGPGPPCIPLEHGLDRDAAAVIVLLLLTGAGDGDQPPRAAHSSSQASTSGLL